MHPEHPLPDLASLLPKHLTQPPFTASHQVNLHVTPYTEATPSSISECLLKCLPSPLADSPTPRELTGTEVEY